MTGREIVNYDEMWAKQAAAAASTEQITGGTFISTRGGVLAMGDEVMPGNSCCVIILDSIRENTFYAERFDPDTPAAPVCYAFARDGAELAPHESMQKDPNYFIPQSVECNGCPHNEWGTADKGRGKACQNRRRLALIPAGYYKERRGSRDLDLEIFTEIDHYAKAEIAFMKLPVTSVKDWAKYVNSINATVQRPPFGVISRIYLEPHPQWQYTVGFEMLDKVPDELVTTILARHEEAQKAIIQGYVPPEEKPPAPQGSLRGLRRGR